MKSDGILSHHLMRASLAAFQCRFDQLSVSQKQVVENTAKKSMTIETLVLKSREAMDVHLPDSMVDDAVINVSSRYTDREEFLKDLGNNNLSEVTLRAALGRELKVDAVMAKVAKGTKPPGDEETRQWYDRHPQKFTVPETRTARHILITINNDFAENERGQADLRIKTIRDKLNGSSEQFQALAKQHSECPTALEGGMLGKIPRGKLFAILDDTLFAMEKGEISDPIESEMGFHILLCEAIHKSYLVPFVDVSDKIAEHLFERKRHAIQKRWIEGLGMVVSDKQELC